jgi:ABC-type nitrate/sulfonate/bicarbonate transport system substrate-binding protein
MMISRRTFVRNAAVTAGGIALFGTSVFAQKTVKIGVLAPSHCALPPVLANTRGLFQKTGVSAEIVFLKDMPEIVKGLHDGTLDFAQLITPITLAAGAGSPKLPKMSLAVTQVLGVNGGVLSVAAGSDIKQITDLKGKRIGIHSQFMVHSLILNLILEKSGLSPEKDIEIKIIPMTEMQQAIEANQIDGFIHPEPLPTFLENKGRSKSLLLTRMFWLNHPCCLLTCKHSLFETEKNLVRDVTLACTLAGLELDSAVFRNRAIADVHSSSAPYQQVPLLYLLKAFAPRRSDFYPFPFQSAGRVAARQMKKQGMLESHIEEEKLVQEIFKSEYAMEIMKQAVSEVQGAKMPPGLNRQEKIQVISG